MESTLIAAISAIVGFVGKSLLDSFFKRREANHEVSKKYSRPILFAAAELQDRLWGLTQRQAISPNPSLLREDKDELFSLTFSITKRHYLTSIIYLFARYFAYIEILKKKVQFIELKKNNDSKSFAILMKSAERALSEEQLINLAKTPMKYDRQIFKLQQAYIGEKLILEKEKELYCMSFAEFSDKFEIFSSEADFKDLIDFLTRAVSNNQEDFCLSRCCLLLNALVDLINFLDPKCQYVSSKDREKVIVPGIDGYGVK
ncbi:hypothetical protein [Nostoc sp. CALU 1950]|uniref:hypothetical protein n=1 Tax=Nostoc sp. CALU 1950 TaxID=3104321 RepID=UPI003EBDD97F